MLGAMAPREAGDLFLVGDTPQHLDGSRETLAGYRSVLSGRQPAGHSFPDWAREREGIAALVKEWGDSPELSIPHEQTVICIPTNQMAAEVSYTLSQHVIRPVEIRADGPHGNGGVHQLRQ